MERLWRDRVGPVDSSPCGDGVNRHAWRKVAEGDQTDRRHNDRGHARVAVQEVLNPLGQRLGVSFGMDGLVQGVFEVTECAVLSA